MSHPSLDNSPSSSIASNPQKRIKLTLKPLLPKGASSGQTSSIATNDHRPEAHTPPSSTPKLKPIKFRLSNYAGHSSEFESKGPEKTLPKIKLRPLMSSTVRNGGVDSEPMDVDINAQRSTGSSLDSLHMDVMMPISPSINDEKPQHYESFFKQPPSTSTSKRVLPPPKPRIPRPIKLKPLKEVLLKIINQIKRKDDYAFFLEPVDTTQVSNYTNIIKDPMDLGTMTEKVERGRYRTLEQFKGDFCLVTGNAKAFNPPGSLYYVEASKIEAYGLDQISKSASQVIEFESDWSLEVEPTSEAVEVVEEPPPTEVSSRARSPSVMSSTAGPSAPPKPRPSRSKKITAVTESWEEGGHLPGHKDGLNAFPPCSELASLMLDLKLRGKKFRSKKERLRREKEGPPYLPDGSLDFTELEDAFLAFKRLCPPESTPPPLVRLLSQPTPDLSQSQLQSISGTPAPDFSPPVTVTTDLRGVSYIAHDTLHKLVNRPDRHVYSNPQLSSQVVGRKRLKHWTITRNPPRPIRANQDDEDQLVYGQDTQRSLATHTDYGAFASLLGAIAEERGQSVDELDALFAGDEKILAQLRSTMHPENSQQASEDEDKLSDEQREELYVSEDYLWEVVYGGVDGLAYFRSLAEFVGEFEGASNLASVKGENEVDDFALDADVDELPLAEWVAKHIVDPLTNGNHRVLRETSATLARARSSYSHSPASQAIARYLALAEEDGEKAETRAKLERLLGKLVEVEGGKIDIAPLLHAQNEMFEAETEWFGLLQGPQAAQVPARVAASSRAAGVDSNAVEAKMATDLETNASEAIGPDSPIPSGFPNGSGSGQVSGFGHPFSAASAPSGAMVGAGNGSPSMDLSIDLALQRGATVLEDLSREVEEEQKKLQESESNADRMDVDVDGLQGDGLKRRARMNLIALAKRAPIQEIAPIPVELVPSHIRHLVPIIKTSEKA